MADEGSFGYATGWSLTAIVATTSKTYWNASSLQADYDSAVSAGKLTCTEHDGSTVYYFDMPAVAAGWYVIFVLDATDTVVLRYIQYWDGTDLLENNIDAISGDATGQINAACDTALNTAIPGSPTADSINERIATMDKILGADVEIDTTTTPWDLVYYEAGTSTELIRKKLRDTAAANIAAVTSVIGSAKDS